MSVLTNLTPLRVPPVRAADRVSRPAPAAVPRLTERPPPSTESLSAEDGRALSIETVNMLGKENPALLARLISDAGRRARGAAPVSRASLSRTALAYYLVGEKTRGQQISDADAAFLADYIESMTRHDG
jgi:hypothetical protein